MKSWFSIFTFCWLLQAEVPAHLVALERTLQIETQAIQRFGQSFETQLFNQDVLSTPRLNATLNNHLYTFDGIAALLEAERLANGIEGQTTAIPPLSGRVAVRTPFYQERISEHIRSQLSEQAFAIHFTSVTPSPLSGRNSYPTSSPPNDENHQCTSGGFFTRSVVPQNVAPSVNLFTDFSRSYDRECDTPDQVTISLNGRPIEVSCGGANASDGNTQNALNEMIMCDPLLYGFHPRALQNSGTGMAACHFPESDFTGRGRTYSANIVGRNGASGEGFRSHCDLIAEGLISPALASLVPDSTVGDRSLVMAAQLAMDNPALWTNKKTRANQHCSRMTSANLEYDHCQNILQRIRTIEEVINQMTEGTLFPATQEPPVGDQEVAD